ncbi:ATP-binding protein [Candidatus Eisenbacteria bacterium]|uniref:histidine kinase n=1 Tax=Eiseniibacteriota bacterium TaxID=2212470 RepID=A0ABV6YPK2_UNCEI
MIQIKNLYDFMEGNFDYLLILDDEERLIHASDLFRKDCLPAGYADDETTLEGLVTDFSLRTFRSAIAKARAGNRVIAVFSPSGDEACSIPLKAGHAAVEKGGVYVFFGNKFEGLSKRTESEKDERIKELACLYKVMEWIEVSPSIESFFTELPRYLSSGLLYPEHVAVHSVYEGVKYGQEPSKDNQISVTLVVGGKEKGVIQVGYLDDKHHLLPEEQKMLNEIGRTLNFALERREYRDKLRMKQEEEKEFSNRLKKLESEITTRTAELEEQREKLNVVNSYLDRVSDGWEESKGRLETMFEAIPDEVVLIDKSRRIVMTNRDDIQAGGHCYEGLFGRERPCEDCHLARILKDKTPLTISMKHDDRYLQVHALPVYNKNQEVDGILEFYRDVTLEKTYEQQLQQADKLASLGQLVSGIGHEINNPNQFIRGNIKIIKQSLDDMLPIVDDHYGSHPDLKIARLKYDFFREHIMTLVDDMAHGSERIKAIVESLRTFARKDEGLLVDTVDINTLIEASARLVHNEVHKRAEIELDLVPDLPTFIGNSQKIEQVLINLLVNAGQAMPDDGKGLVKVRTSEDQGNIVVELEDNGKGMTEKTRKMIFDPFFTTKRAKGGTGLGLAIAFKIINEHNGSISVASELNVGTTFTIRIPAGKKTQVAAKEKP